MTSGTRNRRRPFAELTAQGQARRLRPLAERALAAHGLADRRLRLIRHGENTTFLAQDRGRTGSRPREGDHVVRVHRASRGDAAAVQAELAWLDAIAHDPSLDGLVVPRAHRTPDGKRVLRLEGPHIDAARLVVVFHCIEGEIHVPGQLRQTVRAIGGAAARLHAHAERWDPPASMRERPRWNSATLLDRMPGGATLEEALERLPAGQRDTLLQTVERIRPAVRRWIEMSPTHVIHGDLHFWNVLTTPSGALAIIDFDDCGLGSPLYDIAITLQYVRNSPEHVRAYVDGYRDVRPLPISSDALEEALDDFRLALRIGEVRWVYDRRDNPKIAADYRDAVDEAIEAIEETGSRR